MEGDKLYNNNLKLYLAPCVCVCVGGGPPYFFTVLALRKSHGAQNPLSR